MLITNKELNSNYRIDKMNQCYNNYNSFFKVEKKNDIIPNKLDRHFKRKNDTFSKLARSHTKPEPIIIVLTDRVGGTRGDINGAAKLITILKKRMPNVKVQWIIRQDPGVSIDPVLLQCADDAFVIDRWHHKDYYYRIPHHDLLLKAWFRSAALVLGYSNVPLQGYLLKVITEMTPENTQIINCFEYDVIPEEYPGNHLATGLSPHSMGIFIETFPEYTLVELLQKLKNTIPTFQNCDVNNYQNDHLFFFAYFNTELNNGVQNFVNAQTFCGTIAAYTRKAQVSQKRLDIFCPFAVNELQGFQPNYLYNENVNDVYIKVGEEIISYHNPNPTIDGRTITIVANFEFNHDIFILLMLLAYYSAKEAGIKPIIGCTGDQSLSEVFSLPGAFPFYQVMDWKKGVAQAIKDVAFGLAKESMDLATYFGLLLSKNRLRQSCHSSDLNPEKFTSLKYNNEDGYRIDKLAELFQSCINVLSTYLLKPNLQSEMEQMNKYIRDTKNLYENFPIKIEEIITSCYPALDLTSEIKNTQQSILFKK